MTSKLFYLIIFIKGLGGACGSSVVTDTNKVKGAIERRITIQNGINRVELVTYLLNDTLTGEWEDDIYGAPLIQRQELNFYVNKSKIATGQVPKEYIEKRTKHNGIIKIPRVPLLQICLLPAKGGDLYYVYGADFCNGVNCPEYLGLYNMNGVALYESLSVVSSGTKNYPSWDSIVSKYEFEINSPDSCASIVDIWLQNKK